MQDGEKKGGPSLSWHRVSFDQYEHKLEAQSLSYVSEDAPCRGVAETVMSAPGSLWLDAEYHFDLWRLAEACDFFWSFWNRRDHPHMTYSRLCALGLAVRALATTRNEDPGRFYHGIYVLRRLPFHRTFLISMRIVNATSPRVAPVPLFQFHVENACEVWSNFVCTFPLTPVVSARPADWKQYFDEQDQALWPACFTSTTSRVLADVLSHTHFVFNHGAFLPDEPTVPREYTLSTYSLFFHFFILLSSSSLRVRVRRGRDR